MEIPVTFPFHLFESGGCWRLILCSFGVEFIYVVRVQQLFGAAGLVDSFIICRFFLKEAMKVA